MHQEGEGLSVIIAGGGTGGHLYPALAIAEAIAHAVPQAHICFAGAEGKLEMEKVPAAGYPIWEFPIRGLDRRRPLANLGLPSRVLRSLLQARRMIRRLRPQVVVGVGGYASLPPAWMAHQYGIPLVLQEQNIYPGLANRLLGRKARLICAGFPGLEAHFDPTRIEVTGNPIRRVFTQGPSSSVEEARATFGLHGNRPVVLALGGSGGARQINEGVLAGLPQWRETGAQLIWQTGKFYFEEMGRRLQGLPRGVENCYYAPFLERMDLAYQAANIVVARAGAITLSELACRGKATVLVPSPNVAGDHQYKNAQSLMEKNAALLVADAEAVGQIGPTAAALLKNEAQQDELGQNIGRFCRPHAAATIARRVIALAESKVLNQR
jgi:UDP-N-acetylglucosamine--N-acetylmuramyl-(pentapeptide) pyrophosphoryl-undecaprenol N-acetylglucosamine transferase